MKRAILMAASAASLAGCTYHVHIHNHIPPLGHAQNQMAAPMRPMAAPQPAAPARLAPSPYRGQPPPRTKSLVGLIDGSFSSGRLDPGWQQEGMDGGFAAVVTEGEAWSGPTQGLRFPSPPHAGLVRSSGPAPVSSVGMLISKPFIVAAKTLVWKQQSEALDVKIVIEVEDAAGGGVLAKTEVPPSVGAFQTQKLDVSAACGRPVRVHIRQNTTTAGQGYFSVFDDLGVQGESCARTGNPYQPTHL